MKDEHVNHIPYTGKGKVTTPPPRGPEGASGVKPAPNPLEEALAKVKEHLGPDFELNPLGKALSSILDLKAQLAEVDAAILTIQRRAFRGEEAQAAWDAAAKREARKAALARSAQRKGTEGGV